MRKLRSLRWLCSLSLVASLLCGVAFGAGIPDLDDLGIDPWGEYEDLPSVLPTIEPSAGDGKQDFLPDGGEPVEEIIPFALVRPGSGRGASWYFSSSITLNSGLGGTSNNPAKSKGQGTGTISQTAAKVQYAKITEAESGIHDTRVQYWRGGSGAAPPVVIQLLSEPLKAVDELRIYGAFAFSLDAVCTSDAATTVIRSWGYNSIQSIRVIDTNNTVLYSYDGNLNGQSYTEESPLVVDCHGNDILSIAFTLKPSTAVINNSSSKLQSTTGSTIKTSAYWEAVNGCTNVTYLTTSSASGTDMTETNGLISSIIGWLQTIVNRIGNIATSIAELPGKIVTALIDGLKSLFIPSAEDIENIKAQYLTLLEERLGFLWQAMTFITDTAQKFLTALEGSSDYVFNLPALTIILPSGEFTLVQAQTLNFDNGLMTAVRTAAGTMFSFVVVLGFLNVSENMVVAIVSGKSYFDYLKGGGEE